MNLVLPTLAVFLCSGFASQGSHDAVFTNSVGMKMIKIEPGTFEMGNPNPEDDSWDEQPVHNVTISKPFYTSET